MKQNARLVSAVVGIIVIGCITAFVVIKMQTQNVKPVSNGTDAQQAAVNDTLVAVGKLMVLPAGEEPTVATVIDPEKLKSQPFFVSTQTDDRVLIYINARKAILYRPSENRIIEVAPLIIGEPNAAGQPQQ